MPKVEDKVAQRLRQLMQSFAPHHLEIDNFSSQHSRGAHSHYRLVMASEDFHGKNRVLRHQLVYRAATSLMPEPVHALMLELYSPQEWQEKTTQPAAPPPCRGQPQSRTA